MGLRELKKSRLRQAVQREAFRLFAEQGYQRTTVEQIAEAAEISTTTFYRYYSSKDDVVLTGVYDPGAHPEPPKPPADDSLTETVRAFWQASVAVVPQDRDELRARFQLIFEVPELRAEWARRTDTIRRALTPIIAAKLGYQAGGYEARVVTAMVVAGILETLEYWVEHPDEDDGRDYLNRALTGLAPVVGNLADRRAAGD